MVVTEIPGTLRYDLKIPDHYNVAAAEKTVDPQNSADMTQILEEGVEAGCSMGCVEAATPP